MASMEGDTSPLFRLPEELLELVVKKAPAKSLPALLQTCRRLARIARKRLYAVLKYGGKEKRYDKLVALMDTQPQLGELVKDLTISRVSTGGQSYAPDSRPYPGTAETLVQFPSLKTLRVVDASPDQVTEILASPPTPLLPPLKRIAIAASAADWSRFSVFPWWEALPRFPDLVELTLDGDPWKSVPMRADPGELSKVPATLNGLHTLTINSLAPPTDGAAALSDAFPALVRLTLKHEDSMILRWLRIAPAGLTHIGLYVVKSDPSSGNLSRDLGRFPRLQQIAVSGYFALPPIVPFLRTSNLRRIELRYPDLSKFSHRDLDLLLDLVSGTDRMKHLQSIYLGSDYFDEFEPQGENFEHDVPSAIALSSGRVTVAQLKRKHNPFQGAGWTSKLDRRCPNARRGRSLKQHQRHRFHASVLGVGEVL